jgi:hypothetical protein
VNAEEGYSALTMDNKILEVTTPVAPFFYMKNVSVH